ncbi:MAG: MFS transporter [Actinobacteria bacterium]|nr:MFS transporter [Actinomycetota bacterium]
MAVNRFGPTFPRLFTAALLQELSFMLLIHAPGYFSRLGASEGMIGVLYAASAAAALLMRPLLGRVLDLTHRRTVILVTSVVNIVVIGGLATTQVWGPYLWGLFLAQRVFQIALFTTVLTYAADAIPVERRTQGLAIYGLSGLLPIAIGGFLGDVVIAGFGYRSLFIMSAVFATVAWFVFWALPVLPIRGPQPRRGFWAAMVQPNLLPLWLATLLFSVGLESLFTFTRTFVEDRQVGTAGLFFATYGVCAAVTRILGGRLYDRIQHRPMVVGAIVLYGAGLGVMAVAPSTPFLVAAALTTGMAHGAAFPLLSSEVVNRARESERGSAMSIFTSIFDIALVLGAPVVGFLIDWSGYLVAFGVVGVALTMGALAYGAWDRRLHEPSPAMVGEELG